MLGLFLVVCLVVAGFGFTSVKAQGNANDSFVHVHFGIPSKDGSGGGTGADKSPNVREEEKLEELVSGLIPKDGTDGLFENLEPVQVVGKKTKELGDLPRTGSNNLMGGIIIAIGLLFILIAALILLNRNEKTKKSLLKNIKSTLTGLLALAIVISSATVVAFAQNDEEFITEPQTSEAKVEFNKGVVHIEAFPAFTFHAVGEPILNKDLELKSYREGADPSNYLIINDLRGYNNGWRLNVRLEEFKTYGIYNDPDFTKPIDTGLYNAVLTLDAPKIELLSKDTSLTILDEHIPVSKDVTIVAGDPTPVELISAKSSPGQLVWKATFPSARIRIPYERRENGLFVARFRWNVESTP